MLATGKEIPNFIKKPEIVPEVSNEEALMQNLEALEKTVNDATAKAQKYASDTEMAKFYAADSKR